MEYNLENIPKTEVKRFDGLSYFDFRKTLTPRFQIVWQDIGSAYIFILFFMILSLNLEYILDSYFWFFIPLLSLFIGFFIANLRLFVHEAAHDNIHPDKKKNDLLATIFLCSWFGIRLNSYRKSHWQHHYLLGTTEDLENSYFKSLSITLILSYLSGVYFLKYIFIQIPSQLKKHKFNKSGKEKLLMSAIGILLNSTILFLCIYASFWQTAVVWFLSIVIFFPLFSELRQILEHRNEWADPYKDFSKENHGKICRIFKGNFINNTFGGAGFNRHMLHHWDPEISYTRFDELEKFLMNSSQCWVSVYRSQTTYFDTFLSLVRL